MTNTLTFNDEAYVAATTTVTNLSNCNADCTVHCH